MRLPHRSINSIQPLPSIYTTFPSNYDSSHSTDTPGINSGTCLLKKIEDGIEAVPFERSNILSAPILSPDQEEKEVSVPSCREIDALEKPLPNLPRCMWHRMSLRQRILALLGIQFLILVTIGLSLLAVKGRSSTGDQNAVVHTASDGSSSNITSDIRRGIFALPILHPQQQSSACLASDNQMNSWNCASNSTFQLSILPTPTGNETATMIAVGSPPNDTNVRCGEQIPNIPPLELLAISNAKNQDESTHHFRTTYDKVVLLAGDELSIDGQLQEHPLTPRTPFQPGDSLWQCIFNETLLEGYIYVTGATRTASETTNTKIAGLPHFPYSVKLVEEWTPSGKTPYCRKMTMRSDATLALLSEEITLRLEDPQGNVAVSMSRPTKRTSDREQEQEVRANHCQCQWMVDG